MMRRYRALLGAMLLLATLPASGCSVIDNLSSLVGLRGSGAAPPATPAKSTQSTRTPSAVTPGSVSATGSATASIPPEAILGMYAEQLESQRVISQLADGQVKSGTFGTALVDGSKARLPMRVVYQDGTAMSGYWHLRRFGSLWLFEAWKSSEPPDAPIPDDADAEVVRVLAQQQVDPDNQMIIRDGLVGGAIDSMRMTGVTKGPRTATVEAVLAGSGRFDGMKAAFVLVQGGDSGATGDWFITKLDVIR